MKATLVKPKKTSTRGKIQCFVSRMNGENVGTFAFQVRPSIGDWLHLGPDETTIYIVHRILQAAYDGPVPLTVYVEEVPDVIWPGNRK